MLEGVIVASGGQYFSSESTQFALPANTASSSVVVAPGSTVSAFFSLSVPPSAQPGTYWLDVVVSSSSGASEGVVRVDLPCASTAGDCNVNRIIPGLFWRNNVVVTTDARFAVAGAAPIGACCVVLLCAVCECASEWRHCICRR